MKLNIPIIKNPMLSSKKRFAEAGGTFKNPVIFFELIKDQFHFK